MSSRRASPIDGIDAATLGLLPLPLRREALARSHGHGVLHQWVRRLSDQDVARRCRLLQSLCEHHGLAGDERLAAAGIACDHLSRIDPDPDLKPDTPSPFQLLVQLLEALVHFSGRPYRPYWVVLVHDRNAEHGHHLVAAELLDGPSVAFHRRPHDLEVARHDTTQRLRVDVFGKGGRMDDVTEEDRDGLAKLARRTRRHETSLGPTG
jgi:hypothetical protein